MKAYEMMGISLLSLSSMIGCDNNINPPIEQKQDESKLEETVVEPEIPKRSFDDVIIDDRSIFVEKKPETLTGRVIGQPVYDVMDPSVERLLNQVPAPCIREEKIRYSAFFFLRTPDYEIKPVQVSYGGYEKEEVRKELEVLLRLGNELSILTTLQNANGFYEARISGISTPPIKNIFYDKDLIIKKEPAEDKK